MNLYKNSSECLTKLVETQGVMGLYRGVHLYFVKELLIAFTMVTLYEAMNPKVFALE